MRMISAVLVLTSGFAWAMVSPQAAATEDAALTVQKAASPISAGAEADVLVFSAPPRESAQDAAAIYQPIAAYLTRALGRKVVYRHSNDWLSYQQQMQRGVYHLVFDGPHFNGWRIERQGHNPLVKVADDFVFTVVVRNESKVSDVKQLAGRRVCAMPAPNLGTLTLLGQFDNPARQPVIVSMNGWSNLYGGLMSGKCDAAVLPHQNLNKQSSAKSSARIIYRATPLPNQAFSASPQVSRVDQMKIAQALLAADAGQPLAALREAYAFSKFVPASREEYVMHAGLLKGVWGY